MQKGETSLITRPRQVPLTNSFLLFSSLVLFMLFSQLSTKPFSEIIEYSGLLNKNISDSTAFFTITREHMQNTFIYFDLYVSLTTKKSPPVDLKSIMKIDEYPSKLFKSGKFRTIYPLFDYERKISSPIYQKTYINAMMPEKLNLSFALLHEDVTGYFVQIRANSFIRFATIVANTFSVIFIFIILGIQMIMNYKNSVVRNRDYSSIYLYISALLFTFPPFIVANPYFFFTVNILSSFFPSCFVITSFKVLEKSAPLVPLPIFFKEWTKYVLAAALSVSWFLYEAFSFNAGFIFLFSCLYFIYTVILISVYRAMQLQQRRIDEGSAIWLRYIFFLISVTFFLRMLQPYFTFNTELPYIAFTLSNWIVVGTVAVCLSYLQQDMFVSEFLRDDNQQNGAIYDNDLSLLSGGSESINEDLRKDPSAKRRNIVDSLFNDAFDDDTFKIATKSSKKSSNSPDQSDMFSQFH